MRDCICLLLQPARRALAILLSFACNVGAWGMDTYNPSTNVLTIPYLLVGNTLYTNVTITVGQVVSVSGTAGAGSNDVYSAGNNQLFISSVQVGSQVFKGVTISVGQLLGVGGAWPTLVVPAGSKPQGVAVTPNGAGILVSNGTNPGTISVLSAATGAITATIPVGHYPGGVAIALDGNTAVVANGAGSNNVSVLNLQTNAVSRTVPANCVATTLYDIAVTPNGANAVMGDLSSSCIRNGLDIIDIAAGAITFVDLTPFNGPFGVAVTPDGGSVLATNGILGSTIRRINLASKAVTTIPGTGASFGVAVTPDGSKALLASGQGDTVKVVSLASNSVVTTIPFESNQDTHNIAITPDGTMAVVAGDFNTALVSLATNTVLVNYPFGGGSVAIAPSGKYALVTDSYNGVLRVILLP